MRCAKCHRRLTRDPVMLGEPPRGYGPVCAQRVKPQQQKPERFRMFEIRAPRVRRGDEAQMDWISSITAV